MSRGKRPEGRVALSDFYQPGNKLEGWRDQYVYCLGLGDNIYLLPPPDASDAVREAASFVFSGYQGREYPRLISLSHVPLVAILRSIVVVRGISGDVDVSGKYLRLTQAKISPDRSRAVLISVDSRGVYPTLDPQDVNWDIMHYDERLLTLEDYQRIVSVDERAFLTALCVKPPSRPSTNA